MLQYITGIGFAHGVSDGYSAIKKKLVRGWTITLRQREQETKRQITITTTMKRTEDPLNMIYMSPKICKCIVQI